VIEKIETGESLYSFLQGIDCPIRDIIGRRDIPDHEVDPEQMELFVFED
jgi:hypothetical protein